MVEAMGGGVFTFIVELANGLCNDFDITIAFGMREETPKNYADFFDNRIQLVEVKNFTRSLNPMKDLKAYLELRKIVKDRKRQYSSRVNRKNMWCKVKLHYHCLR